MQFAEQPSTVKSQHPGSVGPGGVPGPKHGRLLVMPGTSTSRHGPAPLVMAEAASHDYDGLARSMYAMKRI